MAKAAGKSSTIDLLPIAAQARAAQQIGSIATSPIRSAAGGTGGVVILIALTILAGWVFASGRGRAVADALRGTPPAPTGMGPEPAVYDPIKDGAVVVPRTPWTVDGSAGAKYPDQLKRASPACAACVAKQRLIPGVTYIDAISYCIRNGKCPPGMLPKTGGGAYVR